MPNLFENIDFLATIYTRIQRNDMLYDMKHEKSLIKMIQKVGREITSIKYIL